MSTISGTTRYAAKLDPVERLVYRSNLLGSDGRITNTGGGNTSSKISMADPLSGEDVQVLWVKGSGGDLRTSKRANFASLYMDKVLGLQQHYHHQPAARPQDAGRGCDGGLLQPLHLQPQPARHVDRHAAARLCALRPRRSYAPQRRDRAGRRQELRAADPGDLWRRGDLDALAAPRLRPGPEARADLPRAPAGQGRDPGRARPDQLGRRRQGLLRPDARPDRAGRPLYRGPRQRRADLRRAAVPVAR